MLQELAVLANGHYISTHDVADLLALERRLHRRIPGSTESFDYSGKTLEEITRSIVQQVLNANGGNQSLTAKQLNISRTTLWRMLSRAENRR